MRFDLTDLRLFLAVADAGSITHGAADVGLSLAAASERLRDMEAAGGVRLLDRNRRGVTPTEAGSALLHHARLILHQMAQMRNELGHHAKQLRSTIRLLANTAAMSELLPSRLAPWLAANPQVDIDLKERQSIDIARSVTLGFAEIGVLSDAVNTSGLDLFPFATDPLVAVLAQDHPLAAQRQICFAEIAREPFLSLADGALKEHLETQASRLGKQLRPRIWLGSFSDICVMAGRGVGIGIVPETAARRCRRQAGISLLRLADNWATRSLSLCIRRETELTSTARDLLRHLKEEA